jgi:hypothetical protein
MTSPRLANTVCVFTMILIDRRRTRPRAIAADLAPFLEMAIDARQVSRKGFKCA